MGEWFNPDGLLVRLGTTEADVTKAGQRTTYGEVQETRVVVDWADLEAFGTETIFDGSTTIPNGAHIKSAEFYVDEAFAGATATLGFGLIDQDRSTAIDADGIDAAIAVTAIDALGDTITCDGALINTTLTNTGLVTATVGTANFTAGKGVLTIKWYIPHA